MTQISACGAYKNKRVVQFYVSYWVLISKYLRAAFYIETNIKGYDRKGMDSYVGKQKR